MSLQKFLAELNSADSQHGVWVNPNNYNDYRIGDFCWENGGLPPKYICIGSLDNLSFGFQSKRDAIKHFLSENSGSLLYKGRKVKVSVEGTLEAWSEGGLDEEFSSFLEEKAQEIENIWAKAEAEEFVNEIPDIIQKALQDAVEREELSHEIDY